MYHTATTATPNTVACTVRERAGGRADGRTGWALAQKVLGRRLETTAKKRE